MITVDQYFFDPHDKVEKEHSPEQATAAETLLEKVNGLLFDLTWEYPVDPDTGCSISGAKGGHGDGGFRLPTSKTGATNSKHKTAHAVDVYDPSNELDDLLTDDILKQHDLYREAPEATLGWCHLQDVPPGSGKRTYQV